MKNILIATEKTDVYETIRSCFQTSDIAVRVTSKKQISDALESQPIEFLFIDLALIQPVDPDAAKQQFRTFWKILPDLEIIVMASDEQTREAVEVVKAGAGNYLTYPIKPSEINLIVDMIRKDVRLYAELKYLRDRFWMKESLPLVQTQSPRMKEVFDKVRAVSPTETTVMITGETGTGKGVIANLIYRHSRRSEKQFIPIHCGAISETLLESELFGHEKGAFTGAIQKKLGKIEIAQGGTLFLDEIGTITSAMQVKLLQVLQERSFQRVGGERFINVDFRLLIASNADLKAMSEAGQFRKDLYFRLNVFPIELPALRERKEDIPVIVQTFLKRLNSFSTKNIKIVDDNVMDALIAYSWPGNIRELENLIERAYVLERSGRLTEHSFPAELLHSPGNVSLPMPDTGLTLKQARRKAIEQAERDYLKKLLQENCGRINTSAARAGISARQLHKLMIRYHIRKEHYKPSHHSGFDGSE